MNEGEKPSYCFSDYIILKKYRESKRGHGGLLCDEIPLWKKIDLQWTPSGPPSAVRLREVSGLERVEVTWPGNFKIKMLNLCTVNTRLFKVCFSYLLETSYSRCVSQFLEISSSTLTCAVTGKRVNRGGCYGLEVHFQYTYSFKGELSGRIAKERRIVEDTLARNQVRKTASKRKQQRNSSGESCSSAKKAWNNCFRLQYNSVVASKLFFKWGNDWLNSNLYCMYSADAIRVVN